MATLTSANSVLMLGVSGLFNVPVQIEGFSVEDMFSMEDAESAEIIMGCDGQLSAGFTPYPKKMILMLQADSASNDIFDAIIAAENVASEKYEINGTILLLGTSRMYSMTRGFLGKVSLMPGAKKTLQPRTFEVTFENLTPAPV